MRTNIDIDEELLQQAMAITGIKKRRDLVELGLKEIIRRNRIQRLIKRLGKTPLALTPDDLEKLRAND